MNLGVMSMKGYPTFPKAPGLDPHHQMQFRIIFKLLLPGKVLTHCSDAVGVFYYISQLNSDLCVKYLKSLELLEVIRV